MKSTSPDKKCTTPPCEAAADQVASEASAAGRAWLADLAPFIAEIVTVILGFPAA